MSIDIMMNPSAPACSVILEERKKEIPYKIKGVAEDIIGPCGV